MHQAAIEIGLDGPPIIDDGNVRPLIERCGLSGVNEHPAGRGICETPLDAAVGESREHILPLLNNHGPAGRRVSPWNGRNKTRTKGHRIRHSQTLLSTYLDVISAAIKTQGIVDLSSGRGWSIECSG